MLELGIDLSSTIINLDLEQGRAFKVLTSSEDEHPFMICYFGTELDTTTFTKLAKMQATYFVLQDSTLHSDALITNYKQLMMAYSPDTIIKVI